MKKSTFVEKILNAPAGSIVFREPDFVLSHDNSARVRRLFEKMGGENVLKPEKLLVVLDRKMTGPANELIHDYNSIHSFMSEQKVERFFDCDKGICHQVIAGYLKQGKFVVGSDSHTCTAGAFNCLAVGLNKTETAVLWKTGKMWFRVPETVKIVLAGELPAGVYAKDLALWVMGMLRNERVDYHAVEYHGEGVGTLSIADRMTIANVSAEMGIKCSVFPPDDILADYLGDYAVNGGVWADENAVYARTFEVNLARIMPLILATHDNWDVKSIAECEPLKIQQGLIGACSCGRLEDLRVVAHILKGHKIASGFQLFIVPASRDIYLKAFEEGIINTLSLSGASVLGASCGPCLGSSHMVTAETKRFITTTNSNSMGRMSVIGVEKYVASPATIAMTALKGRLCAEKEYAEAIYPYWAEPLEKAVLEEFDQRQDGQVWNYTDLDDISCDQIFPETRTYHISMENAPAMTPYLFAGLDADFALQVNEGDIILAGENFGCGQLIKHAAVGLVEAGVRAVIVKSVNRNFYRMAVNHGLLVLISRTLVEAWQPGEKILVDVENGKVYIGEQEYPLPHLDDEFIKLIRKGGYFKI